MQDLDGATSTLDSATQKDKDAEPGMICQNPKCPNKLRAAKVCHHSDCRDVNNQRPLQLCLECDREIHGQRFRSGHLCFDIPKKRGQFCHNAVLTEKRDNEGGNRRTWSEGDMKINQKLFNCDTLNNHDNCQPQCQGNGGSPHDEEQQSNINDGIRKSDHCATTDSRIANDDHSNRNDQQCSINGKSGNNKQHLSSAVKELDNGEDNNGLHGNSFRQLNYRRSYSHDSLSSTELRNRNLRNSIENRGKDQLTDQLFDRSHFANSNGMQHLDSDHLVTSGQSDDDQLDDPSDCDELNDQCHGNCSDCGKNKRNRVSIRNKSDNERSCDEDFWTASTEHLESTSQNFDVDSTDPESDSWNHKLIRKKAMKIRKQKPLNSVLKRSAQEANQRDGVRSSATKSYPANGINNSTDDKIKPAITEFPKTKRTSTDLQQDRTEPRTCTQKPPLPKRYSDATERDVRNEDKLTNGSLKESGPSQCSADNSTLLSKSKPSNNSEYSRTRFASPANHLQSSGLQDESRKKPLGTRILGSTKLNGGEFFRKFSLTSEFFTLRFGADEQMVVAPKGLSLGRAISSIITEKWGLTLDQCDIFLNSSNSALPLSSDCYLLANNTLFVRVKLDDRKHGIDHIIHLTDSLVSPSTPLLTEKHRQIGNLKISRKSVTSEDCLTADALSAYATLSQSDLQKLRNAKVPSKLQSLFQFSKLQDKQEQLVELLNGYSTNGLPKMPDLLTLGRPHYDPSIFRLEKHWKDIVNGHESLTKHQRDQQEAIWELLTTEVEYIRKLHVVIDLFTCCLFNLQNEQLLNEIEADKLFSNIDDVYYSTCHFWNVHMIQVLQRARETREPLNPCLLKSGFHVFDKIFEPYTKYCLEQDLCQDYIRSKTKDNELFRIYIQWGQSQKQCRLLRLQDIMCGPWQRLMRYRLLLKEILKYTEQIENPTPDDQINDLENMIDQVEKFVTEVNAAMRHREESRLMSKLMNRIESYDAVEAPNEECIKLLDKFSKLDLISPVAGCGSREMRMLLFEGSLRLKDAFTKMDVYCFLFSDLFLITKPVTKRGGDKVKVIKPPMRLDKIVVHRLRDPASFVVLYLNEYHVAQAIYTFHGDSRLWAESLKKAQNDYKDKRYQYLMRPDGVFMDGHENEEEDESSAMLAESPSTLDSTRDFATFSRSNSYSSADTFLPNYVSELSLLSAVDPPKDDFRTCGLQRRRGLSTNPRLNGSCDQLALGRKETYPYMLRKSYLSPLISGNGSKALKSDVTSMENLTNQTQNDEKKSVCVNVRHHSEGVGRKGEREAYIKKRLSWNNDIPGTGSTLREPFSRNRNHAMSRSRSPATTSNTRRSATDLATSVVQRRGEVSPDNDSSDPPSSRISSSVFHNGHDISRSANRMRASMSMPVLPKATMVDGAIIDKTLEIRENPSATQRHRSEDTFLLEDCTLEATDV